METLIHADIFFFVTTIVVVLVAIVLIIILVYIAMILSDIRKLSQTIKREGSEIAEDVDMLRQEFRREVRAGSSSIGAAFGFIRSLFVRRKHKTPRSS